MTIVGSVPQMEAGQVEKMMNNNMQVCNSRCETLSPCSFVAKMTI